MFIHRYMFLYGLISTQIVNAVPPPNTAFIIGVH